MARIRTVKPEFWTDEKVVECSIPARLLFIGLFNFANDKGCMERSPRRIKMQVFPADTIDCEPLIMELITHGLLTEYSVNGSDYLQIRGFCKHQKINRPSASKIPDPELATAVKSEGNEKPSMNGSANNGGDSMPAHGALTEDSLTDTDTDTEGKGIKSEYIAREDSEESSAPAEESCVFQEPIGLIPITSTWQPSLDFSRRAATWGKNVGEAPGYTINELNLFRDYWTPTNKVRHHSQWEQAFATSLCKQRQGKPQQQNPVNAVSQPMNHIPEGFVG